MSFLNSWTFTQTVSVSSTAITLTSAIPAGQFLVLAIANNGSALATNTASDTRGNTWVQGAGIQQGATGSIRLMRCRITTALQVGDQITITSSVAKSRWAIVLASFDGVASNTLDASATTIGTDAVPSVGPSGATTTANELVVAAFMFSNAGGTFTPVGVTEAGEVMTAAGTTDRGCVLAFKYVNATGAQSVGGTFTASTSWAGALETVASALPAAPSGPSVSVWDGVSEVSAVVSLWDGANELILGSVLVV